MRAKNVRVIVIALVAASAVIAGIVFFGRDGNVNQSVQTEELTQPSARKPNNNRLAPLKRAIARAKTEKQRKLLEREYKDRSQTKVEALR
ncbi:MAG: hypothetical protein GY847_07140, partial [Proteobacteria bacterium]|nr:hypothetical protein [Pseudomonadota bacterium]